MPPGAAELAVGHGLQPDRLLLLHHVADQPVLDGAQLVGADPAFGARGTRLLQLSRTEQAPDLVGAIGRSRSPSSFLPGLFDRQGYSMIRLPSKANPRRPVKAPPPGHGCDAACARRGSWCWSGRGCRHRSLPRKAPRRRRKYDLVALHRFHQETLPRERPRRVDARLSPLGVDAQHETRRPATPLPAASPRRRTGTPRQAKERRKSAQKRAMQAQSAWSALERGAAILQKSSRRR